MPSASNVVADRPEPVPLSNLVRLLQRLTGGFRVYLWLILLSLLVAAVSLTYPATPSYDPWSWLIWGREIIHGTLSLKDSGSSWKPLPMVFTTVFALAGGASPNLWLLIARAGFVLSVLMSAKLSFRLTLALTVAAVRIGDPRGGDPAPRTGDSAPSTPTAAHWSLSHLMRYGPATMAACLAAVAVALTHSLPGDALMGYSEGLALGLMLIAAERLADGHHRQAFALLLAPALDRPEIWIFWGIYGLWMMWRDRGAVKFVLGLGILALALWFVPTHLGGHSAVKNALTNHTASSAVNSSFPFWTELKSVELHLVLSRAQASLVLTLLVSLWLLARSVRKSHEHDGLIASLRHWRPANSHERAMVGLLTLIAFGFGWFLVVAIETQMGFAGNPRYAVFGSTPLYIVAAVGFGWAAAALARRIASLGERRKRSRQPRSAAGQPRTAPAALLGGATTLLAVIALLVPGWVGNDLMNLNSLHRELRYQARIRSQVVALVAKQGGAKAVRDCGQVMTGNYEVPMVAWYVNTPTSNVSGANTSPTAPATIFQVSPTSATGPAPTNDLIGGWIEGGANYQITKTDPVTLYTECHR